MGGLQNEESLFDCIKGKPQRIVSLWGCRVLGYTQLQRLESASLIHNESLRNEERVGDLLSGEGRFPCRATFYTFYE